MSHPEDDLTSQFGSDGARQLAELRELIRAARLGRVVKRLEQFNYVFDDSLGKETFYAEKRLYIGRSEKMRESYWAELRLPPKNLGSKQPCCYPHFFCQKDGMKTSNEITPPKPSNTLDSGAMASAVSAASEPPFSFFRDYMIRPLPPGLRREQQVITATAFRMMCNFVQFVFLLQGEKRIVYRDETFWAGKKVDDNERNIFEQAILTLRDYSESRSQLTIYRKLILTQSAICRNLTLTQMTTIQICR